MIKLRALFCCITLLFVNFIFTQNRITGFIIDSEHLPIQNATITLIPNNITTNSDAKGKFIFDDISNGNYNITVKYLGLKTESRIVTVNDNNPDVSITLSQDILSLETIFVTGTFVPRNRLETSTSNSILNSEYVSRIIPRGTANLLQEIPGTFVDASAGEVYTKVYSRGVSASAEDDMGWYYVSLQEDGLPVSLLQHSYYSPDLFHRIDLTTQKIEAVRGGSATVTATNAPGGIYNFISYGARNNLNGEFEISGGFQGNDNNIYRLDGRLGGPLGDNWYFNAGGHYRKDDGARNNEFTFSKGGQFKFNVIKTTNRGFIKLNVKILDDFTNRYTGVAATNWDNPQPAFGQYFGTTSLLMPSFDASISDGRNLNSANNFNPSNGVYAKDLAFGLNFQHDLGNNFKLNNNFKITDKSTNWQTSISNAFVSLNNPLAYFISGASFPIGQIVFNDARSGNEVARIDNSGILAGQPIQYLTNGRLPYDAIMGTSAWYKDIEADEWMNQLSLQKKWNSHNLTGGFFAGHSKTSHFTQGSFGYVTYEPNPRMLAVTLENPNQPIIALSDSNGVSNYGGLFYVNSNARVSQVATFINDLWDINDKLNLDIGLRYETITHDGSKDRFAPTNLDGGVDGDTNTAFDNGILVPTGEEDKFDFNYNYLSYSAGLSYKFDSNLAVFSRFSGGHKAPELNFYFNNFSNVPINQKGEVQKILQAEIGVKMNKKNFFLSSTIFWSKLKDISSTNFEFDQDSNTIFYTPILLNESRTIGLEWESQYTITNYLTLNFNGVLQDPKAVKWAEYNANSTVETDDDTITDYSENTLSFNPKLLFNLGLDYQKNKLSGYLKWGYMGEREGNISNGFQLPSYSVFNGGLGYQINNHLSANLLVTNIFNSEGLAGFYGENRFGANASGATPDFIENNPEASFVVVPILGRSGLIKLNYSF